MYSTYKDRTTCCRCCAKSSLALDFALCNSPIHRQTDRERETQRDRVTDRERDRRIKKASALQTDIQIFRRIRNAMSRQHLILTLTLPRRDADLNWCRSHRGGQCARSTLTFLSLFSFWVLAITISMAKRKPRMRLICA